MPSLKAKEKGAGMVLYVVVFIERKVGVFVAKVYAFYMDGAIMWICLLFMKSRILK